VHLTFVPDGEVRLTADSNTELWQPITGWGSVLEALTAVVCLLYISQKTGNFQMRLGIQSCTSEEVPSSPSAVGSDNGQISAVGVAVGKTYRFDPNAAGNGDIDSAVKFRIGILYSSTGATTAQGSVAWQGLAWR
jgi:hypothetical protein